PFRVRLIGPFETDAYEQDMRELAAQLGVAERLEWVGYTAQVQAELQAMDLFVLPSLFGEGMPMVILEAMATGVPVVASEVEGIPEIIRHERDGLLVPAGDPAALASALATLVGDAQRRGQFGRDARQRQIERYSDVAMARAVAQVYDRVLGHAAQLETLAS
ncbi:MAG: glycosyltransferase, partial [Pseudomonadota bacterium]